MKAGQKVVFKNNPNNNCIAPNKIYYVVNVFNDGRTLQISLTKDPTHSVWFHVYTEDIEPLLLKKLKKILDE